MTTITQKIPNLLGGISQQPDVKKVPGQVVDSLNTFPEFALGLMKRPGAKFEAPLRGAVDNAKWFTMLSEDQKYVGQFSMDPTHTQIPIIRVWYKDSGLPRVIDMSGYLTGTPAYGTVVSQLVNETTATAAYINAFTPLQTAQANYLTEYKKTVDQLTSSFVIDTNYNQGEIEQFITTAVLQDSSGNYFWYENGTELAGTLSSNVFTSGVRKFKRGTDHTEEYPILMDAYPGYKLYELIEITEATLTPAQLQSWEDNNYNNTQTSNAVPVFETARQSFNDNISNGATGTDDIWPAYTNANNPTRNYFVNEKDSTGFDPHKHLKFITVQDTTFVLNTAMRVKWDPTKTPVLKFDEAFINYNVMTAGTYDLSITRLLNDPQGRQPHEENYVRTEDNSFGTNGTVSVSITYSATLDTVEEFAADFDSQLSSALGSSVWSTFTLKASGTGIYISDSLHQFDITASGPTDNAVTPMRHELGNVGQLPVQAKNGYKMKIVNSTDVTVDDMWLVYQSENGEDYSPGSWVESNRGDWEYIIDKHTMPHVLKVQQDGSFKFMPWDYWENRNVGDEETNPTPSFITTATANRFINDIFLYRNRLGFLSDDNVFLSRAGQFFDFFNKSAIATASDDPIDISVSTTKDVALHYTYQEAAGLVIFSETSQYLLSTDSDLLAPTTAKINQLTGFTSEPTLPAVSLGSSIGFFTKTMGNTKFVSLMRVSAVEPPDYVEKTKTVPELLPRTIDTVIASPILSLVAFGERGKDIVYFFNYYQVGDKEITNTWYRWKLPGTLVEHFYDDNVYNAILKSGSSYYVTSFDVAQSSTDGVLQLDTGTKTDVCLDVFYKNPFFDYEEFSGVNYVDRTKILIPYVPFSGKKFSVVIYGEQNTTFKDLDVTTVGSDNFVYIPGDWRGYNMVLGYDYTMSVELPKFYVISQNGENVSADTNATVILNRIKVKTGLSGPIDYKVNIIGVPPRTQRVTVTPAQQYTANSVNISETGVHTVPIHQRNHNVTITIEGTTPFPATIESINWEGRYTTNFYRRS